MKRHRGEVRKEYGITELAEEFGTTLRALRFYEQSGLVAPRREGRTRYYSEEDRQRIKFITRGRRMNLSLVDIKEILVRFDRFGDHPSSIQTAIEKLKHHAEMLHAEREQIDWALTRLNRCIPVLKRKIA